MINKKEDIEIEAIVISSHGVVPESGIKLQEARHAPIRRSLPYLGIGRIGVRKDLTEEEKKNLIDKLINEALKEFDKEEAIRREAFEREKVLQKKARKRKK